MIGGPITSGHRGRLPCGVFHFTTGKRAAFQARAQSFRCEEVLVRLRLYAFRTSDEPEACHRFVVGHQRALAHYGVRGLASAKPEWLENPHVFVLAAEDEGRAMLAGIRLHVGDGVHPLPIEEAIGMLDQRLGAAIAAALPRGVGEICGLWRDRDAHWPQTATLELAMASIALTHALGIEEIWGIAPDHTLSFWRGLGYTVERSLGEDGGFRYPDHRYLSHIVVLDTGTLAHTPVPLRVRILDLARKLVHPRIGSLGAITVDLGHAFVERAA